MRLTSCHLLYSAMESDTGVEPVPQGLWGPWLNRLSYLTYWRELLSSRSPPSTTYERKWKPQSAGGYLDRNRTCILSLTATSSGSLNRLPLNYEAWYQRWGSNPRPPPYEGGALNQLSYSGISIRIVDEPPFFSIYESPSMNSVSRAIWRLRPDLNRRPLEWQSSILTNWTTEPNENQESVHHYTIRVELSLLWSSLIQRRITGCLPSWTFPLSCLAIYTGLEPVFSSVTGWRVNHLH